MLRALGRLGVRYVVVGGHAVNFHGCERAVGDLDLIIEPTEENARRLVAALADLRVTAPELTVEHLTQPRRRTEQER